MAYLDQNGLTRFKEKNDAAYASASEVADIRIGADGTTYPTAGDAVRGQINDIQDELDEVTEIFKGKNLYDASKDLINKYLNTNGTLEDYSGRVVTDYLPAESGKYVVCSYINPSGVVTQQGYSAICCYDNDKNVVSGGNYNKSAFLVPSGVAFVRVTINTSFHGTASAMIELSDTNQPTTHAYYCGNNTHLKKDIVVPSKPLGYMQTKGDLADGESLTLPYHNVKNHNVLVFSGKITTFSALKIGKEPTGYVEIDDTNIIIHNDQGSYTEAHGLTISNDIQVLIENETSVNLTRVRVTSSGVSHEISGTHRMLMDEGAPYATSDGSVLTDCVFSWTSRNINKPIWLFGDSYFSWYQQRWTYYLAEDGFTDSCMLNGYAGEGVSDGMNALRELLKIRTPQYVVWCLGMNNADSSTEINHNWANRYSELVELSKYYGFEIVLQTIPNTPTDNNSFKNEVIRNSGYRVIDFADAVNIDDSGNWIAGTLSTDNVHPTANGARVLYGRLLADFPEITAKA